MPHDLDYSTGRDRSPKFQGFTSPKNVTPIGYARRWQIFAMVQAVLSPDVAALAAGPRIDGADLSLKLKLRTGAHVTVALCDQKPASVPDGVLVWTRSEVLTEPRRTTAQTLWQARDTLPTPGDRLRILAKLADTKDGLSMRALASMVRTPDADEYDIIASLICSGALTITLDQELTPESIVRRTDDVQNDHAMTSSSSARLHSNNRELRFASFSKPQTKTSHPAQQHLDFDHPPFAANDRQGICFATESMRSALNTRPETTEMRSDARPTK
jgi:hypothetical protein